MKNKRYALCLIVIAVVVVTLAIGLAGCKIIKNDDNYKFSLREGNTDFYYSHLSENQQDMYKMLCKQAEDIIYGGKNRKTLGTFNFADYGLSSDEAVTVWYAFRYDSPTYFVVSNSYIITPTAITVKVAPEFYKKKQRDAVVSAVNKSVQEIATMLDGVEADLMKFKVIYDYVLEHTDYASENGEVVYDGYTYSMAGALDGNSATKSICQGYAEALCYLCNIFGGQCIYVGSDYLEHSFNIVNINDNWYFVDATNDEAKNQSDPYKYFLRSSRIDTWSKFERHIDEEGESEKFFYSCLPQLSSNDYSGIGEKHQNGIFNCGVFGSDLKRGRYTCEISGYKQYGKEASYGGVVDGVESVDDIPTSFGVYKVTSFALNYSTSLKSVKVPEGFTSSGKFTDCINLVSVELPQSVTRIESSAFSGCTSLKSLDIPSSVTIIDWSAFDGCISLESIELPSSVSSIGWYAFYGCSNLKSIEIPSAVTTIEQNTFAKCSSLERIEIPNTVTTIGEYAFSGCVNLQSIKLPNTSVSNYAFEDCINLKNIEITQEGSYSFADSALDGVDNVTLTLSADFSIYFSNVLKSKCSKLIFSGGETIKSYAFKDFSNLTSVEISDSVSSIGNGAFQNCSNLTSVTFGENSQLASVERLAFQNCSNLTGIELPSSVKYVSAYAFDGCSSLASVSFGDNSQLAYIDDYAFQNCINLTSIELPSSMRSIFKYAFSGCSSLTKIVIPKSVEYVMNDVFWDCINLTIYCEAESKPSVGWNYYWNSSSCPVVWGYVGEESSASITAA